MTTFCLLKYRFFPILVTLVATLQISACGSEDFLTAVSPEVGTSTATEISNTSSHSATITGVDIGSVIEDVDPDSDGFLEVSGKLSVVDDDNGEAALIAITTAGDYGNLQTDADGSWRYTADNSQNAIQNLTANATLTDTLAVSSIDGTTHTIKITIIGVNDSTTGPGSTANSPATISGVSSGSVTEDIDPNNNNLLEVSGTLNISDPDAGEAAFIATTFNGNYGGLTINAAGNWSYAASNNQAVIQNLASGASLSDNLTVSSVDGTTKTISITIFGADEIQVSTNVTLSWVAPAAREDNSSLSLSAIASYKIYYGTTQGQYLNSTTINDGSATSHTFNNFTSATYYFVMTTIDVNGRESQYSPEVAIAI